MNFLSSILPNDEQTSPNRASAVTRLNSGSVYSTSLATSPHFPLGETGADLNDNNESLECYNSQLIGSTSDYSFQNSDTPRTQSSEASQASTLTFGEYYSLSPNSTSMQRSSTKGGQKRGVTVATVGPTQHQGQKSTKQFDSSDYILDKIDYEFYNMARAQSKTPGLPVNNYKVLTQGKKKKKKPCKKDRVVLKAQGVEFDTGDETSGAELKHVLVLNDGYKQAVQGMSLDLSGDGNDTGLGTASVVEGSDLENSDTKQIYGKADVYSEAEDKQSHIYLDSDVAKQIDAQYKQILKKKSGEFLQGLAQKSLSDLSSVLTEELVTKYKQYMVKSISECSFPTKLGPKQLSLGSYPQYKGKDIHMSDLDSVRTEDIEGEFRKAMVKPALSDISQASKQKAQKLKARSKAAKMSKIPKFTANPLKTKKRKKGYGMSDVESVRTEDFENSFHKMMVKQIGGVPITSFDQMMVDSDLDTIKSHVIREKLIAALAANNTEEDDNSEEAYSSDESEKFDTVVDTHKLQELLKETSISAVDHRASMGSTDALQGSPRKDYSFAQDNPANRFLSAPDRSSPFSLHRNRRIIPSPIWENDESGLGNNSPKEPNINYTNISNINSTPGVLIKGNNKEQTSIKCITEIITSPVADNSLNMQSSGSSFSSEYVSHDTSQDSEQVKNNIQINGLVDAYNDRSVNNNVSRSFPSWKSQRQNSTLSAGSASKSEGTSSTFEEVESIDFDMQHDINLIDLTKALQGLSQKEKQDFKNPDIADGYKRSYLRRKLSEKNLQLIESLIKKEGSASPHEPMNTPNVKQKRKSRILIEDADEEENQTYFSKRKNKMVNNERQDSVSNFENNSSPEWVLKSVFQRLASTRKRSIESNVSSAWSSSFSSRGSFSVNPYGSFVNEGNISPIPAEDSNSDNTENNIHEDNQIEQSVDPHGCSRIGPGYLQLPFETGNQMYRPLPHAEDMLLNLGFGGVGSFLPERFAKDWYNKIIQAERECTQQMYNQQVKVPSSVVQPSSKATYDPNIVKNHISSQNKIKRQAAKFVHKLDLNSRTNANHRRSRWRRAVSVLTMSRNSLDENNHQRKEGKNESRVIKKEVDIPKQDSLDQLKSVLERQAQILHLGSKKGERRRQQFINNRQKSLPLFLETLSEEDEAKLSRGSSIDKKRMSGEYMSKRSVSVSVGSNDEHDSRAIVNSESKKQKKSDMKKTFTIYSKGEYNSVEEDIIPNTGTIQGDFGISEAESLYSSSSMSDVGATSSIARSGSVGSSLCGLSFLPSDIHRSNSVSSFEQEIECPTDDSDSITCEIKNTKRYDLSPILNQSVSLGQTGFSTVNQLNLSPLSHSDADVSSDIENNSNSFGNINVSIPNITVTRINSPKSLHSQSSSSLEIQEIMGNAQSKIKQTTLNSSQTCREALPKVIRPNSLKLVPAMVSVVLNDVEDNPSITATSSSHNQRHKSLGATLTDIEDRLRAPSPSLSNMSSSPVPLSPITVIEMDNLDNQNDSMDSGDTASTDHNINKPVECFQIALDSDLLMPISEVSDEGGMSTDISRDPSFEEIVVESTSSKLPTVKHDVEIVVDDGNLSPIYMLGSNMEDEGESAYSSALPSAPSSDGQQNSPSPKENMASEQYVVPHRFVEESIQTEDHCISPIMINSIKRQTMFTTPIDFYIACDRGIQCGSSYKVCTSYKSTQTDCSDTLSKSKTQYNSSSLDFEPQFISNIGCQTDSAINIASIQQCTFGNHISPKVDRFTDLLCCSCKVLLNEHVNIGNKIKKHDNFITTTEQRKENVTGTHDNTLCTSMYHVTEVLGQSLNNSKCDKDQLCNSEEVLYNEDCKESRKFSPSLLVQEMLDRSISMTDYIERNISIPECHRLNVPEIRLDRTISVPDYVGGGSSDLINEPSLHNTCNCSTPLKHENNTNDNNDHVNDLPDSIDLIDSNVEYSANGNVTNKLEMMIGKVVDIGVVDNNSMDTLQPINDNLYINNMADDKHAEAISEPDDRALSSLSLHSMVSVFPESLSSSSYKPLPSVSSESTPISQNNSSFLCPSVKSLKAINFLPVEIISEYQSNREINNQRNLFCSVDDTYDSPRLNSALDIMETPNTATDDSSPLPSTQQDYCTSCNEVTIENMDTLKLVGDVKTNKIPLLTASSELQSKNHSGYSSPQCNNFIGNDDVTEQVSGKTDTRKHKIRKTKNNYLSARKRKSVEKVDAWLQKSLSYNEDLNKTFIKEKEEKHFEFKSTEENNTVCNKLQWEKKVLKSMSNQSAKWLKYFTDMDNNRHKLVPSHPFQLNNTEMNDNISSVSKEQTEKGNTLQNNENRNNVKPACNSQFRSSDDKNQFDLNNLLSRIEHIESLITTVTTTYNSTALNFEEVSRQISDPEKSYNVNKADDNHMGDEVLLLPGVCKAKKNHKREKSYKSNALKQDCLTDHLNPSGNINEIKEFILSKGQTTIDDSVHIDVNDFNFGYQDLIKHNMLLDESDNLYNQDIDMEVVGLTLGYQQDTDSLCTATFSGLHNLPVDNLHKPPLTPVNTLDIHDVEDHFMPSAFRVVFNKSELLGYDDVSAYNSSMDGKQTQVTIEEIVLMQKLQEIENEIVRDNEMKKTNLIAQTRETKEMSKDNLSLNTSLLPFERFSISSVYGSTPGSSTSYSFQTDLGQEQLEYGKEMCENEQLKIKGSGNIPNDIQSVTGENPFGKIINNNGNDIKLPTSEEGEWTSNLIERHLYDSSHPNWKDDSVVLTNLCTSDLENMMSSSFSHQNNKTTGTLNCTVSANQNSSDIRPSNVQHTCLFDLNYEVPSAKNDVSTSSSINNVELFEDMVDGDGQNVSESQIKDFDRKLEVVLPSNHQLTTNVEIESFNENCSGKTTHSNCCNNTAIIPEITKSISDEGVMTPKAEINHAGNGESNLFRNIKVSSSTDIMTRNIQGSNSEDGTDKQKDTNKDVVTENIQENNVKGRDIVESNSRDILTKNVQVNDSTDVYTKECKIEQMKTQRILIDNKKTTDKLVNNEESYFPNEESQNKPIALAEIDQFYKERTLSSCTLVEDEFPNEYDYNHHTEDKICIYGQLFHDSEEIEWSDNVFSKVPNELSTSVDTTDMSVDNEAGGNCCRNNAHKEILFHTHSLCDFDTNISEEYYDKYYMEHHDSLSKLTYSCNSKKEPQHKEFETTLRRAYSVDYGSMTAKERRQSFGRGTEAFEQ